VDTQPNLARVPLLYVPFDFFLAFFFMTLFLAVGPLSQSKQWQQADERGVNRSWQRGNNFALLTALDASPRSLRRDSCDDWHIRGRQGRRGQRLSDRRSTWRYVEAQVADAANGGDVAGAYVSLLLVLTLERVECSVR
jgi:hypothetical protein